MAAGSNFILSVTQFQINSTKLCKFKNSKLFLTSSSQTLESSCSLKFTVQGHYIKLFNTVKSLGITTHQNFTWFNDIKNC